jgi:hypothetical protein
MNFKYQWDQNFQKADIATHTATTMGAAQIDP